MLCSQGTIRPADYSRTDCASVPLLPAQQAFALVEPGILPDPQARARQPVGKGSDGQLHRPAEQEAADRPQLAAPQGIVEKAQQPRKKCRVEYELPPRAPGDGHGMPRRERARRHDDQIEQQDVGEGGAEPVEHEGVERAHAWPPSRYAARTSALAKSSRPAPLRRTRPLAST